MSSAQDPLKQALNRCTDRVDTTLERLLPAATLHPVRLHQAMRYAVFNGGKRIRPVLVYCSSEALGGNPADADCAASAVELIHAYSLVHDDLPAMDDDDLRRGKPTCHRAFDEATAILVGDGLQALAFQALSHGNNVPLKPAIRLEMIDTLARAAGSRGMVGGQAIDLQSVGETLNIAELEDMHIHKTGALIRASVKLGVLCAGDDVEPEHARSLDRYAQCIGLAFQIRDDILDVEASTEDLGKKNGADAALRKPTYPSILGLDGAKQRASELHEEAVSQLDSLGAAAEPLRLLSAYIVARQH